MLRKRKSFIIIAFFLASVLYLIFGIREKKSIPSNPIVHDILGMDESCMQCHGNLEGFAPAHNPKVIGCTPCHSGNPLANGKEAAHMNMITIPGNLSDVHKTCGAANCHLNIADRVAHSLMTTMSGVISVDRFVFGELDSPAGSFHIKDLGFSAADTHLRHLCASCHLGNQKDELGPITELSRGGGCNACHLNYSENALAPELSQSLHPGLTIAVKDDHCFGCHSRSSRISLNYEGWHETNLTAKEMDENNPRYRLLQDGRVVEFIVDDVHHQAGLSCIDCHHVDEVMGDGMIYQHKEEALKIQCKDCHTQETFNTVSYEQLDAESKKLLALRNIDGKNKRFLLSESGKAMINTWVDSMDQLQLVGKNNNKQYDLQPPASVCTLQGGHSKLDCGACHTGWAPQCIGCHNTFDKGIEGYDLLKKEPVNGRWVEHVGVFFSDLPTLGVVESSQAEMQQIEEIKTFISGMILSVDKSDFEDRPIPTIYHRLYAPTSTHTTSSTGRSCKSCHNNPLAIGYGRGKLSYETSKEKGIWRFIPEYANSDFDQLPEDAWIGFLQEPKSSASTRPYARPFTLVEQQRILTVGACFSCHDQKSELMLKSITNFQNVLENRSELCIIPDWGAHY
jgi:hypothetical protein